MRKFLFVVCLLAATFARGQNWNTGGSSSNYDPTAVAITGGTIAGTTITGSTLNSTAIGVTANSTGRFTNLTVTGTAQVTGAITPGALTGIVGTTAANSANAGSIGEFVTATVIAGSAVSLGTGVTSNVTSVSLTAGDWDVSTFVNFIRTGATGTNISAGPSVVSATLPAQPGGSGLGTDALAQSDAPFTGLTGTMQMDSGPIRVLIGSTTTVFLTAQSTFTVGTVTAYGTIRARRVR